VDLVRDIADLNRRRHLSIIVPSRPGLGDRGGAEAAGEEARPAEECPVGASRRRARRPACTVRFEILAN
jgi:hypothetical protein